MKIVKNTKKSKRYPEEDSPKKIIDVITEVEKLHVDAWLGKHRKCKKGIVTAAWFGLQWDNCPDYMHITCGCGHTYIRKTPKSIPICSDGEVTL